MSKTITSGDFLIDKIFFWVMNILYNHPIIISKKAFQKLGMSRKDDIVAAACTKGLLEPGDPETIYLNPATSFNEQKHSLFHEGIHLLFSSIEDELVGQNVREDEEKLEREIIALDEYIWERLSGEQKEFFGDLINNRRAINSSILTLSPRKAKDKK